MKPDALVGATPEQAFQTLLPRLSQEVRRLKRHGENSLNHLVIRPGWEENYEGRWPSAYEGHVGSIYLTYAVEDRTQYGPHDQRHKQRMLAISFIETETANVKDGKYAPENPILGRRGIPFKWAKLIANGFFQGEVEYRQHRKTGDWAFWQVIGKENHAGVPYPDVPGMAP